MTLLDSISVVGITHTKYSRIYRTRTIGVFLNPTTRTGPTFRYTLSRGRLILLSGTSGRKNATQLQ